MYSHSATWWKSWGFVSLHSECFSAHTFAAPFCVRPCVRHAGSGCDLLPVAMELTFQGARGHLDHLLYRSVVKALVEAASMSNMVLKAPAQAPDKPACLVLAWPRTLSKVTRLLCGHSSFLFYKMEIIIKVLIIGVVARIE